MCHGCTGKKERESTKPREKGTKGEIKSMCTKLNERHSKIKRNEGKKREHMKDNIHTQQYSAIRLLK